MQLNVFSEISRLREVLVHAPGPEVDNMPPSLMTQLLFDDILHGPKARLEHGRFRAVLEALGVKVHDMADLIGETVSQAKDLVPDLVDEIHDLEDIDRKTARELRDMSQETLASALIEGLPARPEDLEPDYLFRLPPLPNLLFSRDAQIVLGKGLVVGAMSRRARQREPLLSHFVFSNHRELRSNPVYLDFLHRRSGRTGQNNATPTLEGGDVMIFNEGVVLVGISERTMERAVDLLAACLRRLDVFHTLIMVPIPRTRSAMHLDTIFTRISANECLVFGPMVLPGGAETLSVITVDLRRSDDWGARQPSLLEALERIGIELEPVCCGGRKDYIQQAREQWTDGANSFAVAPGVIMLYARNQSTAAELARKGYRIVSVTEMKFTDDGRCLHTFGPEEKYVILLTGDELSRARGGPRCMAMPLVRDDI